MRSSISAQSWDSRPPAPGWMLTMASCESNSPESRLSSSRRSTSRCSLATPRPMSPVRLASSSSCASWASSSSSRCSAASLSQVSTVSFRAESCPRMRRALSWSSQRSGWADCFSSSSALTLLPSMSKVLLYLAQPSRHLLQIAAIIAQHFSLLINQDPQQFLYFFPLPQGQGAFLPTFWERAAAAFFSPPSLPLSSTTRRVGFSSAFTTLTWNI